MNKTKTRAELNAMAEAFEEVRTWWTVTPVDCDEGLMSYLARRIAECRQARAVDEQERKREEPKP